MRGSENQIFSSSPTEHAVKTAKLTITTYQESVQGQKATGQAHKKRILETK